MKSRNTEYLKEESSTYRTIRVHEIYEAAAKGNLSIEEFMEAFRKSKEDWIAKLYKIAMTKFNEFLSKNEHVSTLYQGFAFLYDCYVSVEDNLKFFDYVTPEGQTIPFPAQPNREYYLSLRPVLKEDTASRLVDLKIQILEEALQIVPHWVQNVIKSLEQESREDTQEQLQALSVHDTKIFMETYREHRDNGLLNRIPKIFPDKIQMLTERERFVETIRQAMRGILKKGGRVNPHAIAKEGGIADTSLREGMKKHMIEFDKKDKVFIDKETGKKF